MGYELTHKKSPGENPGEYNAILITTHFRKLLYIIAQFLRNQLLDTM